MLSRSDYRKCPVCGRFLLADRDVIEGNLCEAEEVCDGCRLYHYSFAYGWTEERIGFADFAWSYTEETPSADIRRAEAEMRTAFAHPEWAGVRRMPLPVAADWLGDHGCPFQEGCVRAMIAASTEVPPNPLADV